MPWLPALCLTLALSPQAEGVESVPAPTQGVPAAAGPTAPDRPLVLVLDLESQNADPGTSNLVDGFISTELARLAAVEIVTEKDMKQLTNIEAQRAALGCDDASCLAEIAGALGAGYVVYGSIGKLGELTVVQLNLFDSSTGRAIARQDARTLQAEELAELVPAAALKLMEPLLKSVAASTSSKPGAPGDATSSSSTASASSVTPSRPTPTSTPPTEPGSAAGSEPTGQPDGTNTVDSTSQPREDLAPIASTATGERPAAGDSTVEATPPDEDGGGGLGWTLLAGGAAVGVVGFLPFAAGVAVAIGAEVALTDQTGQVGRENKGYALIGGQVGMLAAAAGLAVVLVGVSIGVVGWLVE